MSGDATKRPQLVYFNVPGRVAGLRIMMFKIYGKDGWEDRRVAFKDWPKIKPTLPLQFLPLLTLPDGRTVQQAEAISRWAAKKAGLYPADADEALFVDEMSATVFGALSQAPRPSSVVTTEMLPGLWDEFARGPMAIYFDYFQERLAGCEDGPFLRGADLTAADLALYMLVSYFVSGEISFVPTTYVRGWPKVAAHHDAVTAHPLVVAYHAAYADGGADAIDEVKEFEKVNTSAMGRK